MMQAKDTYDNILACSPFKSKKFYYAAYMM